MPSKADAGLLSRFRCPARRPLLIGLERLQIEPPLVAEGVVEALPTDSHRGDQVFGGGRCEAFHPEHLHRALQGRIAIEFPRPDHDEAILCY